MAKAIRTAADMIHFFKSNKYVAARLGVSERTVSNWVTGNYIGRESTLYFYQLLVEFKYPNASLSEINKLTKINTKQVAK